MDAAHDAQGECRRLQLEAARAEEAEMQRAAEAAAEKAAAEAAAKAAKAAMAEAKEAEERAKREAFLAKVQLKRANTSKALLLAPSESPLPAANKPRA